jgi:hypothetical protein
VAAAPHLHPKVSVATLNVHQCMFPRQLPRLPGVPGLEHLNKLRLCAVLPELVLDDGRLQAERVGGTVSNDLFSIVKLTPYSDLEGPEVGGLGRAVQVGLCTAWDAAYGKLIPRASQGVCTVAKAANSQGLSAPGTACGGL